MRIAKRTSPTEDSQEPEEHKKKRHYIKSTQQLVLLLLPVTNATLHAKYIRKQISLVSISDRPHSQAFLGSSPTQHEVDDRSLISDPC